MKLKERNIEVKTVNKEYYTNHKDDFVSVPNPLSYYSSTKWNVKKEKK